MGRHRSVPGTWSPTPLLLGLGAAAVLVALVEAALIVEGPADATVTALTAPATGLVYCLASLVAWSRRPSNPTCALLTFGGLAWFAAGLQAVGVPALAALGELLALLPVALTIHLLLAFPSGVLSARIERIAVACAYAAALALQPLAVLFGRYAPPFDVLVIAERPALVDGAVALATVIGFGAVALAFLGLRRRLRAAPGRQRRALLPFAGYAVVAMLVVPIVGNVLPLVADVSRETVVATQRIVLAGIPLAAVATMLLGGFARIGAIEELGAWLGAAQRTDLRLALARVLGDRSLELGFRLDDGSLVDSDGRPYAPPQPGDGRRVRDVELAGRSVAVVAYDPTLVGDGDEITAAARVLALWIERERLTAALLASDRALRSSRLRVIEAADEERRRIARDLHDGLASRLLLLAVRADHLAGELGDAPDAARALTALRDGLEASLAELRGLVQGMMPAGLVERGLHAALEDLVDRMPLPTRLECRGADRLAEEIETAAWFVVAEALANTCKHAHAQHAAVRVVGAGDVLTIEVADDGVGGATPGAGAGLRGMADRVEAYGGRLTTSSPDGGGTTIVATLPRTRVADPVPVAPAGPPRDAARSAA